jgi:protein-S-isoprenylcysteine O-methyltransferase Ste14
LPENETIAAVPAQSADQPSRLEAILVRFRVHVGFLIAAGVLIEGLVHKETPMDLRHPSWWLALAIPLVIIGMVIRFISLGTIRKNESLATKGIYSLCRHPLYLGSLLLYFGVGVILQDSDYAFWYLGLPYIFLFYSAAIRKEERFLRGKFGGEFDQYKSSTPALIPLGRFKAGEFSVQRAFSKGGTKLVVSVACIIAAMQAMVEIYPRL